MNTLPKKNLIAALSIYKNVFGTNELVSINIENKDNKTKCYMDVNNSKLSLRVSFDLESQSNMSSQLVMETDRLLGFLKGGFSDKLKISTNKHHMLTLDKTKLKVGLGSMTLKSWGALSNTEDKIIISSAHLFAKIAKAIIPFSTGGHHGVLESISIVRDKKDLKILGTDGFRIGIVCITDHGLNKISDIDIVIPNMFLDILSKLTKSEEPCSMYVKDKIFRLDVSFDGLSIEAASPLVTSAYPSISPLLSSLPDYEWELDSTDLLQYCSIHRGLGDKQKLAAKFVFNKNKVLISTIGDSEVSSDISNVKEIKNPDGKPLSINISLKFIINSIPLVALNGAERIRIGYSKKTNLIWVRADRLNKSVRAMAIIAPVN